MGDDNKFAAIALFTITTIKEQKCDNSKLDAIVFASNKNKKTKEKDDDHCCHLLLKQNFFLNAKKGGSLPFFSYFYVWDEVFLLPSPLHVFSTFTFGMKCPSCLLFSTFLQLLRLG
jgi:hypothetical protein